jgi:hypothetical protein
MRSIIMLQRSWRGKVARDRVTVLRAAKFRADSIMLAQWRKANKAVNLFFMLGWIGYRMFLLRCDFVSV